MNSLVTEMLGLLHDVGYHTEMYPLFAKYKNE
jgi:hypothetical protein